MTTPANANPRGLAFILLATAIAGISGYAIQILAAAALPGAGEYLAFSAFWSTMFLFGGAIGGVQQEVARASYPREGTLPSRTARAFALSSVAVVAGIAVITGGLLAPIAFGDAPALIAVAFVIGLLGYLLTSIATGLFYGLGKVAFVAWLIIVDAVLRGVGVVVGLAVGAPPAVLAFAIAIPFGLSIAVVWAIVRRSVVGRYAVDVGTRQLAANALRTVGAAAATGLMVTGMPILFRLFLEGSPPASVASLTLVVTLTRAPLIIPLMALQSYLVVDFRDAGGAASGRLARLLTIAAVVSAAGAVAAWFVGPWVIDVISGGKYAVDSMTCALVIVSAALVAMLCITGPALVAQRRHSTYVAGWAVAAVATVALLAIPLPTIPRVLIALTVAPALGLLVHLIPLLRARE